MVSLAAGASAAVLTFPEGLPGLGELRRFRVVSSEELQPITVIESLDDTQVRLPLIDVDAVWEDYDVRLEPEDLQALEAGDFDGLLALCVLLLSGDGRPPSCNLFAPIVVNPRTMLAKQVIQAGSDYPAVYRLETA